MSWVYSADGYQEYLSLQFELINSVEKPGVISIDREPYFQMSGKSQVHHSRERKIQGEVGLDAAGDSQLWLKTINHAAEKGGDEREACVIVDEDKRFWSIWAEG